MSRDAPFTAAIFFQANTIKGYEAWDKAGLLANELSDRFQTISYGPLGLICSKPTDPKDHLIEVRVDPQIIHLTYAGGSTWDDAIRESSKRAEWIARAISVSSFSRLGLRAYLVWKTATGDEATRCITRLIRDRNPGDWTVLGDIDALDFSLVAHTEHLQVRLAVRAVMRSDAPPGGSAGDAATDWITRGEQYPDYGVLIDADLYRTHATPYIDTLSFLRRCKDYITERILPFGNMIVGDAS